MTRPLFAAIGLLSLACLFSGTVNAQQKIYQWKDASGRTHYSSSPPTSGKYDVRGIAAKPASAPANAAKAPSPSDEDCNQARGNLAILKGNANVQIDSDGDSKPDKLLTATEHAAQVKLAESLIAVRCMPAA